MRKRLITVLGKSIKKVAVLKGGAGSAMPGLIIEKIDKNYTSEILNKLPLGVVVISGTNGKTTTTKIVVEILESYKLKVFTNQTGSNFSRGITSELLSKVGLNGKLDADIAVLELDEAHAVSFVKKIKPNFSLILNVLRDQLDRYGEIDKTARLLSQIVSATNKAVILNREDVIVSDMYKNAKHKVKYFGFDNSMNNLFSSDSELYGKMELKKEQKKADVILRNFVDKNASFEIDQKLYSCDVSMKGVYNIYNVTAAICLVKEILGIKFDPEFTIAKISRIQPSFGRGETLSVDGTVIEIILVKNPAGFKLALLSYDNKISDNMIVINDNYADSRDVSWLWDVDFTSLIGTRPTVSGTRATDIALRLHYDDIVCENVDGNISHSLKNFIKKYPNRPKRIYCTYTAMLKIRSLLTGKSIGDAK